VNESEQTPLNSTLQYPMIEVYVLQFALTSE